MIKTIEIQISSGFLNSISALIIPEDNICYINDRKYQITNKEIDEIKSILTLWKNEYGNSNKIDIEEFNIKVSTFNDCTSFHGKGFYPDNYNKIKEILGDISGR
jgi:hypothetical protein